MCVVIVRGKNADQHTVLALRAIVTAGTVATAGDAIAGGVVVALAVERTVHAVLSSWTRLLARRSNPSQRTPTVAVPRIAVRSILATTLLFATWTVLSFWTY